MKKIKKSYYKDRIQSIMFEENWIEVPLFYNNAGKSIRFLLESKLEQDKYNLIMNILYDIFFRYGDIVVISFGDKGINHRRVFDYFKLFSLKKLFKKYYQSKLDSTWVCYENPYYVSYLSEMSKFKINKYLKHLFESNITVELIFLNVRKGVAIHFYDDRGFDIVSEDRIFAKYLYEKYKKDVMECNINFNDIEIY